jgi:hypothetical protein
MNSAGFLRIKPGDTYSRAGKHYHPPGELTAVFAMRTGVSSTVWSPEEVPAAVRRIGT